ncbi:MAG: PEP-utilizing enzyme [Patescibacteria group bacterium]
MSKWYWYTRGTIHPHRADQLLIGIGKYGPILNVGKIYETLYINLGDKLYWAWNKKEIQRLGQKILQTCSTKSKQKKHITKIMGYINQAIQVADKIKALNLKIYSNQELADFYNYLLAKAAPAHGLTMPDIDSIDVVSEDFLQKQIRISLSKPLRPEEFNTLFQKLARPIYESYLFKEKRAIIMSAVHRGDALEAKKLFRQYWWASLGWETMETRSLNYYKKEIKRFKNKKLNKAELNKLDQQLDFIRTERNQLIKKYHLGNQIRYWLKFFDLYAYIHDLRKEMQNKTTYSFYLLLKETARRFKLSVNNLEWLFYDDVKKILCGEEFNLKEIVLRKKAVYVLVDKSGIERFSGPRVLRLAHKVLDLGPIKTKIIKGTPVSPGKLIAKVKVCSGSEEAIRKIKRGDILVCGMTLPNYVPAMKKAVAIITDEGGLTCHAAIIARELNKPCIVGAKIASRVLKDGDRVEVDANKGIVRKL